MVDNIQVAVRVRPLISRELEGNDASFWTVKDRNTINQINSSPVSFTFDRIFEGLEQNQTVYEEICSPIVKNVMQGFNGTIFAYGQTSSGKTFTMTGDEKENTLGVLHHTVSEIFQIAQNMPEREFLIRVSCLEIYNEKITDLLSKENDSLKLQEDKYGFIKVVGLKEHTVQNTANVLKLMKEGQNKRHTEETLLNPKSSRSHSIFRMIIESRMRCIEDSAVHVSQLNLVDLAGSERVEQAGTTGARFKESVHINKSLFMLSQVISQLSENHNQHISYRDSKLTRLLQNSLGGNALTAILCTVTPASLQETLSTLKFASRAKTIKNKPKINEIKTDQAVLKQYENELKLLNEELMTSRIQKEALEEEKKQNEALKSQIEELKAKFSSQLVQVQASVEKELEKSDARIHLEQTCEVLRKENVEMKEIIKDREKELVSLQTVVSQMEVEISQLKEKLANCNVSKYLDQNCDLLLEENAEVTKIINGQKTKLESLQTLVMQMQEELPKHTILESCDAKRNLEKSYHLLLEENPKKEEVIKCNEIKLEMLQTVVSKMQVELSQLKANSKNGNTKINLKQTQDLLFKENVKKEIGTHFEVTQNVISQMQLELSYLIGIKEELESFSKENLKQTCDLLLVENVKKGEIINEKEIKVEALQIENNLMQYELSRHKEELQQKVDALETEFQRNLKVKNQLKQQQSINENLLQELQNAEMANKSLQEEIEVSSSVREKLQNEIGDYMMLMKDNSKRISKMEKCEKILEEKLSHNQNLLSLKANELKSIKEKIVKELIPCDPGKKLEQTCKFLLEEMLLKKEESIKEKETKLELLKNMNSQLQVELSQHKQEVHSSKELEKKLELQCSVNTELQQQLKNSEDDRKSLKEEIKKISACLSEKEQLQVEHEKVKEQANRYAMVVADLDLCLSDLFKSRFQEMAQPLISACEEKNRLLCILQNENQRLKSSWPHKLFSDDFWRF